MKKEARMTYSRNKRRQLMHILKASGEGKILEPGERRIVTEAYIERIEEKDAERTEAVSEVDS